MKVLNTFLCLIIILTTGFAFSQQLSANDATRGVSAEPTLINTDFESGTLDNWTPTPENKVAVVSSYSRSSIYTIAPYDGVYMTLLTAGKGDVPTTLSQTFSAVTGDMINGWACFGSSDQAKYNDYAKVVILDSFGKEIKQLYYADVISVGGVASGSWQSWEYVVEADGVYTIVAQVVNALDRNNPSVLALDYRKIVITPKTLEILTLDNFSDEMENLDSLEIDPLVDPADTLTEEETAVEDLLEETILE